ncbi:MAG: hypothetical protein QOE41_2538 [Mycobacterium sp.]|nr:hypothetical protein [Mycobacterium sp.]MDT5133227.1 hypothetical protein [Mycobacterium sp.]
MDLENAVYPTRERVEALRADSSRDPVVMLNLLKFRSRAVYPDGRSTNLTGRQAYELYASAMQTFVEEHGGRFLFAGDIASLVIGEVEDMWDICALVEYPSAAAFAAIAVSADAGEIGVHRAAGLEGQLLIRLAQRPR